MILTKNAKGKIDLDSDLLLMPKASYLRIIQRFGIYLPETENYLGQNFRFASRDQNSPNFMCLKFNNLMFVNLFEEEEYHIFDHDNILNRLFPPAKYEKLLFMGHQKDFWVFGRKFLQSWAVSFDLEEGLVYFGDNNK